MKKNQPLPQFASEQLSAAARRAEASVARMRARVSSEPSRSSTSGAFPALTIVKAKKRAEDSVARMKRRAEEEDDHSLPEPHPT